MERLIDAGVFEKFIKEKYKDGESTDDIKDQMLFDLSYQPTAYDVEKVVEEVRSDCYTLGFDESQTDIVVDDVRRGGVE